MATEHRYIDFGVAPYALPDVCEALWNNGIHNGFLTLEDGNIHVRWEYDVNRKSHDSALVKRDNNGGESVKHM